MKQTLRAILVLLVVTIAARAEAATLHYVVAFTQTDPAVTYPPNPCGADHCGSFDIPSGGSLPTSPSSFSANFAFQDPRTPEPGPPELFWNPLIPNPGPPEIFFSDDGSLSGILSEVTTVGLFTLMLNSNGTWQVDWAADDTRTPTARYVGTYAISAVPMPAALPLLTSGLGALGVIGWRRKRKSAAVAA